MSNPYIYNLPLEARTRERLQLLAGYLMSLSGQQPDERPPSWFTPVRWEPLDVEPATEVDALVGNIFKCLRERFGVSGHQGHAMTFEKMPLKSMAVYNAKEASFHSKLGLVYYEDSLYAFISGSDGAPDDESIRPWLEAIAYAERERSQEHPLHEWCAVVGPTSDAYGRTASLGADRVTIGKCVLERCSFSYEEQRPRTSLNSWSTFRWVPVVVRGSSPGHDWGAAEFVALKQVHRLCALLSLEIACHWTLKEAPRPAAWGPPLFPDETPLGLLKREGEPDAMADQVASASPIDPARLSRMWARCEEDETFGTPVEAYYQAGSLRDSHPSLALVGFVGAIEEVGKLLVNVAKSERCPACGKDQTSTSFERFREALRLVLPEDKLPTVSRDLYRWRSGTAHAGRTYSWESSFGRPEMGDSMLVSPPQSSFGVRGPMRADELARAVLLILLEGQSSTL